MDPTRRIYLDYAASAPVHPDALTAFVSANTFFGNPSSPHEEGREAAAALRDARTRIAHMAGVKPRHVVFTSGATEANALAIQGFIRKHGRHERTHVLYLSTAHASSVHTVEQLQNQSVRVEALPLSEGKVDFVALETLVTVDTCLVVLDAVCGETGTRFDLRGVRKVLDTAQVRLGIPPIQMHVDASQLPFVESFDRLRLAADTVTLDAQKVGGVRGIGALIVGDMARLAPIVHGGGQEEGLRPGTEPVALAAAFAVTLEHAAQRREDFVVRAERARDQLIQSIITAEVPGVIFEAKSHAPHIVNVSYPGIDTDFLVMVLDAKGFSVSTKSACETDNEGSRAIMILTGDNARARSTLRISWGPDTSEDELASFAAALNDSVRTLAQQDASFDSPARA